MSKSVDHPHLDRVAALYARGPAPVPVATRGQRVRARLRGTLLRLMRPYARYQREIEDALLDALRHQQIELDRVRERHDEQIERLEHLCQELILATESLYRRRPGGGGEISGSARRLDV